VRMSAITENRRAGWLPAANYPEPEGRFQPYPFSLTTNECRTNAWSRPQWEHPAHGRVAAELRHQEASRQKRFQLAGLAALLAGRFDEFNLLGHLPAHLLIDEFAQGNVRRAQAGGFTEQRAAAGAAGRVELAHSARDQVHQHVGVPDFHQGLSAQFAIHNSVRQFDFDSSAPKYRSAPPKQQKNGAFSQCLGRTQFLARGQKWCFSPLTPGPLPVEGRESSGLCARIAPRNLTRALLAGLDHKR